MQTEANVHYATSPEEGKDMNCMVTYKWTNHPKQKVGTKRLWVEREEEAQTLINHWNKQGCLRGGKRVYSYELLG